MCGMVFCAADSTAAKFGVAYSRSTSRRIHCRRHNMYEWTQTVHLFCRRSPGLCVRVRETVVVPAVPAGHGSGTNAKHESGKAAGASGNPAGPWAAVFPGELGTVGEGGG